MSNKFYSNAGHFYAPHVMPVMLNTNFVVDPTNGLGITSLKGPGIANVFMHTSTTPAVGNRSALNPNPANGIIVVQLGDPYFKYLSGDFQIKAPNTGSALTSVTANVAYVITTVGTTTTAQWVAKGLPVGITPAVGAAFIASATGALGGTGDVKVQGVSGISCIEVLGDPDKTLSPVGITIPQPAPGGSIFLQTLAATSAGVTTMIPTAPAAGSNISLTFYLSNSSATSGSAG